MPENGCTIAAVIPAWNAAPWIARAIESVLAQSRPPEELIVVDDGSTDATAEIVRGFGDRVRLVSQANRGLSAARNAGIRAAGTDWIAFLDADDYWQPGKLEAQARLLADRPELAFVSCAARLVYEDGGEAGHWPCMSEQEARTPLETLFRRHAAVAGSGSAVVARRDLLLAAGGFDESLRALEDIDMWMRLAQRGGYACLPEPLVVIRRRRGSMSGDLDVMKTAARRVMAKNRGLLASDRGRFWHQCYAAMLTDYAKWELRAGRRWQAAATLLEAGCHAPLAQGRLVASLWLAWLRGGLPAPSGGSR
ncbi:MAG: glycosyltransferase family 2 protein [Gammaproteobacteria bacterium]|nr:MAG: glycosyltransferase family 2 protein [Gammaproteobacteria bacterium]